MRNLQHQSQVNHNFRDSFMINKLVNFSDFNSACFIIIRYKKRCCKKFRLNKKTSGKINK